MAVAKERPLRFRGPPAGLTALLVGRTAPPSPAKVFLAARGKSETEYPAEVTPFDGRSRLFLTLPRSTAPGQYRGRVLLGKKEVPALFDVEAEPELDAEPASLRLSARAGQRVELEFTLYNAGNVPVEVRGFSIFGLFPDEGAERAILRSHNAKTQGSGRLEILLDALAQEFAGTVRLKVDDGAGTLGQGQARVIGTTLVMPDHLEAGRSYSGIWAFEGFNCSVRVDVPPEKIR